MRDIARRLERLEEAIVALDCICGSGPPVAILAIEDGWDEERIAIEEDAKRVRCPVHGFRNTTILRLVGSDVHG